MCKPKPVETNEMISFFFYYVAHLLPVLVIIIHMYNPNQLFFHQNIGPSPSCLSLSNSLHQSPWIFLLTFSPCWSALMTSRRVHYDSLCIPSILGCLASDAFSCSICFGAVSFFQFDSLCDSPICVLFPLESTF